MRYRKNSELAGFLTFCIVLFLLVASGCVETEDSGKRSAAYWPNETWRTSIPEQQGLDSEKLAEALDFLQKGDTNIHSLLIIRNGYIVTDAYFFPFAKGSVHDVASVTKSFTGTLIGIAISEGYIKDVKQPVLEFFPERTVAHVDAKKKAMTLEDLLTMRSGLQCINKPSEITFSQMQASHDWVQFALDLPMIEEPGNRFVYCSSNSHLLSGIIREITGMNELDYAQGRLFKPLGISNVTIWPGDPQGNNNGAGDLHLTPQDMAKLGYLYLNKGTWDGKQVVPAEWVSLSTQKHVSLEDGGGYGYQWWIPGSIPGLYEANGRGGQRIIVWPEKNIIIVTTGGGFEMDDLAPYLLAAIKSDNPLPENPQAYKQLQGKTDEISRPAGLKPEPVKPLPEIAKKIQGKTYVFDPNPIGLKTFSLTFDEAQGEALLEMGLPEASIEMGLPADQKLEYRLGLDNVSRISSGRFNLPAATKGSWESGNVFVINFNEVANINQWKIKAIFQDNQVTLQMQEKTGLGSIETKGRLEDSSGQSQLQEITDHQ